MSRLFYFCVGRISQVSFSRVFEVFNRQNLGLRYVNYEENIRSCYAICFTGSGLPLLRFWGL